MKNKKYSVISISALIIFNIIVYLLLNNELAPHISPKFTAWAAGFFSGVLGLWTYLNIKRGNI